MKTARILDLKSAFRFALLGLFIVTASCAQKKDTGANAKTGVKPPQVDIHTAVAANDLAALKQHIAAGSNLDDKDPYGGSSPLISAGLFGRTEAAKILIDAGADVNAVNNDGSTALHTSAFFCHPDIVKMLLDKHADKTIRNKFGSTPYESVVGPYSQVKSVYEAMQQMLGPMGLKLDYAYIEKTRPVVAEMLK